MSANARGRRDALITGLSLLALLAWDAGGLDLPIARLFGDSHGFAWRDSWWASAVLHEGGRRLAWVVLAGVMVATLRAPRPEEPTRMEHWRWIGVMLLCVIAVPALKQWSLSSCPWELAEFGGGARYVSHWRLGLGDGGPGRCFPSGHAVSAFAFFGLYFMWREHAPRRARAWLAAVGLAGLLFGSAQLVRGAHYPSHTLWTAWLCWTLCAGAAHLQTRSSLSSRRV